MTEETFRLNPALDAEDLAARFRATGRVNIADFLAAEDAGRLHRLLKESSEWRLVLNQGDKVFELDRAAQAALDPSAKARLEAAVHAAARYDFQYMFETIRVPDEEEARRARGDALAGFASFLSSPAVMALLRHITGRRAIDFADAQATAYGLGHFLSAHDDDVEGKNRHAAYVFGLSSAWRPEWGGLLLFHGPDGHIAEAYVPQFNSLTLFAVPQPHSVSMVAPFAAARRYSVTGWLRSRSDDAAG
ncbi:MAG TPA: 2OG-Fe(II) oxygenase family protein [Allosphingosinicella sp.]|jgi:Rps23 Pro-64 3,4-dihydroxylase Tpa1-like proline 4-hydroxylase